MYGQYGGGLQITFISDKLVLELGFSPSGNTSFIFDTMTGSHPTKADLVEMKVESLYNDKTFDINNIVFNKPWKDYCNSLSQKLSLEAHAHFIDVYLKLFNNCECIGL